MERLTEWQNGELLVKEEERLLNANGIITKDEMYKIMRHLAEKLADYEDKEEQGLLIELKAKIGDAVYTICGEGIKCDVVRKIMILPNKTFYLDCHGCVIGSTPNIYLTEAEAEEALARMKGE